MQDEPIAAPSLTGADVVLRVAERAGIRVCFANPGTSELPLLQALDRYPAIRPVLGLFEGVCSGAADGYARISGAPALVLLHMGPGLANGLSNLHNARRAGSPVVTLVGDHATWYRGADAPLASDIRGLATPMSVYVCSVEAASEVEARVSTAIEKALGPPSGPSTIILPSDVQWSPAPMSGMVAPARKSGPPSRERVERAAHALRRDGKASALFIGGRAQHREALAIGARLAAATKCRVYVPNAISIMDRGAGIFSPERLPYVGPLARRSLSSIHSLVLVDAAEPVAPFASEDGVRRLCPDGSELIPLVEGDEDPTEALRRLADELSAPSVATSATQRPAFPDGALTPHTLTQAVAALQPEHAIVMDEGLTATGPYYGASTGAPPFSYLSLTGGAIGQGLPCALGAAVAAPERQVIALEGDGSILYTIQSLRTIAAEKQKMTIIVAKNRSYSILRKEMRARNMALGSSSLALTDLEAPDIDFCKLALGFGIESVAVSDLGRLRVALETAFATPRPILIEVSLPSS